MSTVRSFGTEDRPTPRPVSAKEEIYEFIIFRGSDIKGIDVIEPPAKEEEPEEEWEDPAIVSSRGQGQGGGVSGGGAAGQQRGAFFLKKKFIYKILSCKFFWFS